MGEKCNVQRQAQVIRRCLIGRSMKNNDYKNISSIKYSTTTYIIHRINVLHVHTRFY